MIIIATLLLFLPFYSAQGYLDPGSGSFIIQLFVGAVLGSLVAIKVYFKNIKKSIAKLFSKKNSENKENDGSKTQQ